MDEVSCRATRVILDAVEASGVAVAPVVAGLRAPLAELRDPKARIDWDVFADFLARVDAAIAGRLTMEEVGARILKVPSFDLLRRAGQLLMTPRQLYEVARRFVAPLMFHNVVVEHEWLDSGRLVVTGALLPGYAESVLFFRLCHGNVAALPRVLDLPPARIEEQTFSGRRGRLVLVPPGSHTLVARVQRGARALGALSAVLRGIEQHQEDLDESLAALRSSRHEMQLLIERLPDGVLIHRDGIVQWANAALAEILGLARPEDLVGRPLLDLVPAEDRAALIEAMRRSPLNQLTPARAEYRIVRPDGTHRRVQAGAAQIVEIDGEPARMVVVCDVTEQHRLREQAAIADRLASLGALAAGVAHEINNPLAYVRLSLEMAARETAALEGARGVDLRESIARAREGTERVLEIVRDLKMLSRVHEEPLETLDVQALLDSTVRLAERALAAKGRINRNYGPTPPARAARGKLAQVFLNLLTNAADAIPEGARADHVIAIATSTDAAGHAVVEIRDTGCGVPAHVAGRVFDPFFTTKPVGMGTGLGLAMCHRIVTELGGTITFESAPGATTFRVTLPAATLPVRPRSEAPLGGSLRPPQARGRVLVIDDEPAILRAIEKLIDDRHDVVGVGGAREALAILEGDRSFDVILADLMMADLTGMDLYDAVRDRHPGLEPRFLFMTGGAFTPRARSFLAAMADRCLEKPFGRNALLDAMETVLGAAPPPAGGD